MPHLAGTLVETRFQRTSNLRRSGRVAEGVPLLRVYILTGIEGSNPSFSAITYEKGPGESQGLFRM